MQQERRKSTSSIGKPPIGVKAPYSEESKKETQNESNSNYENPTRWSSGQKPFLGRPPLDAANSFQNRGLN